MKDNEHLWNQFIKLGDMMGDGLHHEPDGKWITREYKKLMKILCPPTEEEKAAKKEIRQKRNKLIDEAISTRLQTDTCNSCTGKLIQTRSGSKVVQCTSCEKKYVYKAKKKKK